MQDWILSDTPLASQRVANEPPQERHVTLVDAEDVFRRIQREGRLDDLREAASLCERWAELFRAMAPEPPPAAVMAPRRPEPTVPAPKAVQAAPQAEPPKWTQASEVRLRRRCKDLRITGQQIADAVGCAQTTGNAWLRGDTRWDLREPGHLDKIQRLADETESTAR